MAKKKLNKSGLEILAAFDSYLKQEFTPSISNLIAPIKQKLLNEKVDLSEYNILLTYGEKVSDAAGKKQGLCITLEELLAFHKTGRYRQFDIRTKDFSRQELIDTKPKRPLTYTSNQGIRPLRQDQTHWDGSFVLDIDIRKALYDKKLEDLTEAQHKEFIADLIPFRKALHERLCRYHWCVWTAVSASMGGVHIRTKTSIDLYIQCLESYLVREEIEYTEDKLYELARNLNIIHKYAICYQEMLACLDVFNKHYGKSNSLWFEDAVDKTAIGIHQGMFISYDPALEINDNFKDVDFFIDAYDVNLSHYEEWLRLDKVQEFIMQTMNPFRGSMSKPTKDKKVTTPKITAYDVVNDSILDVSLFRSMGDQLYDTHNELYWRTATYLYYDYAGQDRERTIKLCQQLFDPASKHSRIENIKARIDSIATNQYPLDKNFLAFISQVVYGKGDEAKIAAEQSAFEIVVAPENTYQLAPNEYVGDYIEEVVPKIAPTQSLVLISGTGTGKTEGIMRLVATEQCVVNDKDPLFEDKTPIQILGNGKRMLIIEPFKSIIRSKFNKYEHLIEYVYEDRSHKREKDICVAIIDKVREQVHLGTMQNPAFDYIVIDESHLLTMSEYRENCGLLLDFFRNKSINAKIIYMTGTPVFEKQFLKPDTLYVRFEKPKGFRKEVNIYPAYLEPLQAMKRAMADEILKGRKVICILGQKSHMQGIINTVNNYVEKELGRKIHTGEFTAETQNSELAKNILEHKCLGDVDIAFVTAVFSVGVDIEGEDNAVIYTFQELNGIAVDQYANRLRHTNIEFNMYGRYKGGDTYRELSQFAKDKSSSNNDELFLQLLNSKNNKAGKALLKESGIPYIIKDYALGWCVNQTLKDIHNIYGSWDEWSSQYHVCAHYLRQLGYEVTISAKKITGIERPTAKEINKEQTMRRNTQFDRFMFIWDNYKCELENLYNDLVDTSILLQKGKEAFVLTEKRIVAKDDTSAQQTIYTNEPCAIRSLLSFMRVLVHYKMDFEFFVKAVEGTFIHRRNKQISCNKLDMLSRRLWWQSYNDQAMERVVATINTLNTSLEPIRLAEKEYTAFLDRLIVDFWGNEKVKSPEQMRRTFEDILKLYYYIRRKKVEKGFVTISARHDDAFEKPCATKKEHRKLNAPTTPQQKRVVLETVKNKNFNAEILMDLDFIDFTAPI